MLYLLKSLQLMCCQRNASLQEWCKFSACMLERATYYNRTQIRVEGKS